MKLNRLNVLKGWMLVFCMAASAQAAAFVDGTSRSPNVVFIVVDDLGWKDLGCYGSTFYETPNMDRLAAEGMLFTDAYSANPTCSPTRCSIMTGWYPVRSGFLVPSGHVKGIDEHVVRTKAHADQRAATPKSVNFLDPEYYSLGEAMKDAGYATSFFGKWHLGHAPHIPENNGFDFVVGGRHHPGPPGKDGRRQFFPPWRDADTLPDDLPADKHIDDYLADRAVDYIAEHKDKPFFMCFWTYSVHAPIQSKPELVEKWKKKADVNNPQHCPTMGAMIEVVDESIGRVIDALKANGIADNTIVIFTSDNGGMMYESADGTTPTNNHPLRGGKGTNYEGGVRIPLIVRWPGKIKAGSVNRDVVSTVDHYPTLLELTGQKLLPEVHKDGVSFLPALKGKKHDRGPTVCEWTSFTKQTHSLPSTHIRVGDWKLLRFWFDAADQSHRYELYNLKDDLSESNNLDDAYPEKVQSMIRQLDDFYTESGSLQPRPNENYHGRTVGVWAVAKEGKGAENDGALSLTSNAAELVVETRVVPFANDGAIVEFEARSETRSPLSLQWKVGTWMTAGEYSADHAHDVALSNAWKTYHLPLDFENRLKGLRFILGGKGAKAEIRNARVLTTDGSLMMQYRFDN